MIQPKKLIKIISCLILALFSTTIQAKKEYTPAQLRSMIESGNYPDQGALNKDETISVNWLDCLVRTDAIIDSITPHYPVAVLVNTQIMRSTKFWANDAATVVTCHADGRMHIISAPYK